MLRQVHPHPLLAPRGARGHRGGVVALMLALVASSGCARSASAPVSASDADVPAPYPFSVYEIRAGCPLGRVIEYRVEKAGAPPTLERWAFTPLDGATVSITTSRFDAEGKPVGSPTTEQAKWTELHEHARFPRAETQIYNESLTVPAGTFDVMRYVVTKGASGDKPPEVKTYWFARTLAGPPVKVEMIKDGKTFLTMTMEANRTH